jgi:tryptophan-rich sensory protein
METTSLLRAATPDTRVGRAGAGETGIGLLLVGGAVLASALIAARWSPAPVVNPSVRAEYKRLEKPPFTPPDWVFGLWGPLYAALTWSGVRLWNAPRIPGRDRALGHFLLGQALTAAWQWLGFGRRNRAAMAIEAAGAVVNAVQYVRHAAKVDRPSAWVGAVYAGWLAYAALLSEELWRRNRDR